MQVKCLVQVGAEDGFEAAYIARDIGCRAVAIEANPENNQESGVEHHNAIIGATNGMTVFYRHGSGDLSGHFPRGSNETRVDAMMTRLDTFCEKHDLKPDALIIDTEGSALEVLEGSTGILDGVKMIYAEVQDYPIREGIRPFVYVHKFLAARGFTCHDAAPTYGKGDAQWNQTWVKP